jgi:hypothetical protein
VIGTAILFGISLHNLQRMGEIRRSWAYASAMPVLPWTGTGLSPVLQWLVVPGLAFALSGAGNSNDQ